ncbi:VOC family protein [Vibrio hannami]|uniref:VOC family protein n=1 Tax=Vibrio hannami TaxID=2717094 RepID=UPI00241025A2|nr:VOC family protein [Vibrio hannami]MDG3085350.1 VOC family protein [Vibrio hannami]
MKILENYAGHIGVPVRNLATTVSFYQDLGFEMVMESTLEPNSMEPIHVAFMGFNELLIEFYQTKQHKELCEPGPVNHIAVRIEDMEEIYACLESKKVPLIKGPTRVPFGSKGMTFVMIEGPDKERIEFDQFH